MRGGRYLLIASLAGAGTVLTILGFAGVAGAQTCTAPCDIRRIGRDSPTDGSHGFSDDVLFSVAVPEMGTLVPGDELVLTGEGDAHARANGRASIDYGSANFDMSTPGQLGQPELGYCKPF